MNVFVLATCRNPELIRNTLLVFKTFRVGFPNANLIVYGNGLAAQPDLLVREATSIAAGRYIPMNRVPHGVWIEGLLGESQEPFWICDTDVVFFEKVEDWFVDSASLFAGRYEPEYVEPWTRMLHVARLHPSLMWFNAPYLRAAMRGWPGVHEFLTTCEMNLIRWNFVPKRGWDGKCQIAFYDTCAGLHHALGGEPFTDEQNRVFEHLFAGTYSDLLANVVPGLKDVQAAIFDQPELARGLAEKQRQWYADHKP